MKKREVASMVHFIGAMSVLLAVAPFVAFAIGMAFTGERLVEGSSEAKFFGFLHGVFYAGRFLGPLAVVLGIASLRKGSQVLGSLGIAIGVLTTIMAWSGK